MKKHHPPRHTARWLSGALLSLLILLTAACGGPQPEEDLSAVFGPGERLAFDHLCAGEHGHAASAWVVFADRHAGGLALALLQAGWVGAKDENGTETPGVALFPLGVRITRPPAGSEEALRLVFRVGSAENGPDVPALVPDGTGMFSMSEESVALAHEIPNGFAVPASALAGVAGPRLLALKIRSTRTGEEVVLRGPEASGLEAAMRRPLPTVEVLGILEVLDPRQEGGLVDAIADGVTFEPCIGIRKGLLRKFERDVRAGAFDGAGW